ncbi:MAG: PSD1 domain-containing protein [Pirellulaceae bacterium]|nr:PSD1 domain-containing protein [Pirellulaceae bacterium]
MLLAFLLAATGLSAGEVAFNRDIRPLLSDKCFACHGPDKNRREADLRLDTEQGLLGEAGEPGVVVPGKPDDSELIARITSTDDDLRMPPPDAGKDLKPEEIELLRRWVEQGGRWEGHWSLQPIARPEIPQLDAEPPVTSPIDAFVLRQLREAGLQPAPEADRRTLVRRLSLDLLGLPPDPAEVERFVQDTSDNAYEALVDRLLESPHYGERMAMWWLDLVRYADSVGYHGDQPVSVSPFRDYVIRSFNDNKPFDQFTLEQLAGDLLPGATLEQQIASGYNRLGMMSAEGGVQPKEYLAKYISERVRNLGGAWLGLTTGCCECHDHKYDPLTMRDFYSLEAFFADIEERGLYSGAHASGAWGPNVKVPTPDQAARLAEFDRKIADVRRQLDTPTAELAAAQTAWEATHVAWSVLVPESFASEGGATLTRKDDHSILASGKAPERDTYTLTIPNPPAGITALRLEVLPDDSLPKKGPGRAGNGNFVLTELVVRQQAKTVPAAAPADRPVKLASAAASFEQAAAGDKTPYGKWTAAGAIDGDAQGSSFGWAVLEQVGQPNFAVFTLAEPLAGGEATQLILELRQQHDSPGHTLGRFRLLATTAAAPVPLAQLPPANIAAILARPAAERDEKQQAELAAHYRSIAPQLEPLRTQLRELEAQRAAVDQSITTTLVTRAVAPRTIRILPRGNWMDDSGEIVPPAFPSALQLSASSASSASSTSSPEQRLNRADLARWLTSPDNPLTARVLANRVWKLFFGAGLSRKLDDLGAQGEWPSHPELLDWLAGRTIDSGWDVKGLVKLIVMSDTYRRSSAETEAHREADPFNRLLARQSRFRLDAEAVRDNALAISGLLVDKIGGPSVKPYQPPGYWAYLNFPTREWQNGSGEELYRRGLYTHWQRQYLHPSMLAFDGPSREECVADRPRSNTPLQSLVLLNDPTYVEAARALAERILRSGGDSDQSRLDWVVRRAVARPVEPAEVEVLLGLLDKHRQQYQQDPAAAQQLLSVGAWPVAQEFDAAELAAWTSVARAVLMLHETITRN